MFTRTLTCPGCEANLRITGVLRSGRMIKCPRCETRFAVPEEEEAEVQRARKPVAVPEEDEGNEEPEERPVRRPPRKKAKKAARPTALVLGLVLGGLILLLGAGVGLAAAFWPRKKADPVVGNPPPGQRPDTPAPAPTPGPGESPVNPGTGTDQTHAAGRRVFDANNCARCHALEGSTGGGKRGGRRGPSLARTGANPRNTVEWLSNFLRNPKAENPTSRMPAYDKIPGDDLRALAEFLASLK